MRKTLFALLFVLAGCGAETAPTNDPVVDPGPTDPDAQVRLVLFGAAWCANCSRDIPVIQSTLKGDLASSFGKVQMELWVPTGATPAKRPNDAVTQAYAQKLNFSGSVTSDAWRWKYFRELLPGTPLALPAAALVDLDGNVVKRYMANAFNPADIVADTKANLK